MNGSDGPIRCWVHPPALATPTAARYPIGVVEGEGIGPELTRGALEVLSALEQGEPHRFDVRIVDADSVDGIAAACRDLFEQGGALLAGPRGGRFVYDLRRRLDLYCKISPIAPCAELADAMRLRGDGLRRIDLLVLRENTLGLYQGSAQERVADGEGQVVTYSFTYTERAVRRMLETAAAIAAARRGRMAVVVKRGGLPELSRLWEDAATAAAAEHGLALEVLDIDYAAYRMLQHPEDLDVIVAPNLFGDVLSDLGGVLVGSRALTYGGSFGSGCGAVYQTNHGAAWDLEGSDRANPAGHLLALAMLLRESLGLVEESARIHAALQRLWRSGWRTADLVVPGCRLTGTRQMCQLVADTIVEPRAAGIGP